MPHQQRLQRPASAWTVIRESTTPQLKPPSPHQLRTPESQEQALKAIDEDWNPQWPAGWQRHFAALRELVRDEEGPAEVLPGFTVHGMDVGKWLAKQRKPEVWAALADGQRERLEAVGVVPLAPGSEAPAKPSTAAVSAFERGIAALAQYKTRTGSVGAISRSHVEVLPDGSEVKLGVWLSNTKTRRGKLTTDKLQALADLGLDWAAKSGRAVR